METWLPNVLNFQDADTLGVLPWATIRAFKVEIRCSCMTSTAFVRELGANGMVLTMLRSNGPRCGKLVLRWRLEALRMPLEITTRV